MNWDDAQQGSIPAWHALKKCNKAPHKGGELHSPEDDSPYSVDGVFHCGRCHAFLGAAAMERAAGKGDAQ